MEKKEDYKSPAVIEIVSIVKDRYLLDTSAIESVDSYYQFEE